MLDNLQQSREVEQRFTRQQQRLEDLQSQNQENKQQRRRQLMAAIACVGVAISVFPGAWQQLADAPVISWLMAGLAVSLLWPRDS
jgi:ubiquinone biosynthesis protein